MSQEISELKNMTIKELIDRYPGLIKLFMNMGLLCIGCPAETFHTVTDIAREYGLDLNHLVDQINRAIQNTTISSNSRTQRILFKFRGIQENFNKHLVFDRHRNPYVLQSAHGYF